MPLLRQLCRNGAWMQTQRAFSLSASGPILRASVSCPEDKACMQNKRHLHCPLMTSNHPKYHELQLEITGPSRSGLPGNKVKQSNGNRNRFQCQNSIAFSKSTSQRIHPEQCTTKWPKACAYPPQVTCEIAYNACGDAISGPNWCNMAPHGCKCAPIVTKRSPTPGERGCQRSPGNRHFSTNPCVGGTLFQGKGPRVDPRPLFLVAPHPRQTIMHTIIHPTIT